MKSVLDVCCGGKMFYFNKSDDRVIFMDKRCFSTTLCDGRGFEVKPDIVGDFTKLPFEDNSFTHVVFDPPHLVYSKGSNSKMETLYGTLKPTGYMHTKYGHLEPGWKSEIRAGFAECFRVLAPQGTLNFKWSEIDIKVSDVIALSPYEPLYGVRNAKRTGMHWVTFIKPGRRS